MTSATDAADVDPAGMGGEFSSLIPVIAREHRSLAAALLRDYGLYPGQELLLQYLWAEEPRLQSDLARLLEIEAPTATKMLQRMEAAGLLSRSKSPDDARQMLVRLTEDGRALREPIRAIWEQLERGTTATLSAAEQRELARLLRKVRAAVAESRAG
ncbi:MAG: hypothetical protein JWP75_285 [Frondihabitans sp.]|nr:hypothetical protein [Frondihabitans sp.]